MLRGKQSAALEMAREREAGLGAVRDAEGLGCSLGGAQKPPDAFKKQRCERVPRGVGGGGRWWERLGGGPGQNPG